MGDILSKIVGDRIPLVSRPPDGYRWGMEHSGEPVIVRAHDFPPESYVVRELARDGTAKADGSPVLAWAYSEIVGIDRGSLRRRFLFSEKLQPWEYATRARRLRIDPVTIPAKHALDDARRMAGFDAIEYWRWCLATPGVVNG